MRILGVDPGLNGALALYSGVTNVVFSISDIPTLVLTVNGKKRNRLDSAALAKILSSLHATHNIDLAIVEDVHAMPKQGVASSFSFGFVAGALQQAIVDANIPMTLVQPAAWKRFMGVKADKASSLQRASQLMPSSAHHWPKKSHDGRAEAALLAYYGAKLYAATFA